MKRLDILYPNADILEVAEYVAPFDSFVAGGAARHLLTGQPFSDIDVFSPTLSAAARAADTLVSHGWQDTKYTKFATTQVRGHRPPVQFIHTVFGFSPEVLKSFDFYCSMFALDFDAKELVTVDSYSESDAFDKAIRFNRLLPRDALALRAYRVEKYTRMGYHLPASEVCYLLDQPLPFDAEYANLVSHAL